MKIVKMSASMGQTISKTGDIKFENLKPHTGIEVEVDPADDVQEVRRFIQDHLRLFQAEVEHTVRAMIASPQGMMPLPQPLQQAAPPQQPRPTHQMTQPPTHAVNQPGVPTPPPARPDLVELADQTIFEDAQQPLLDSKDWDS